MGGSGPIAPPITPPKIVQAPDLEAAGPGAGWRSTTAGPRRRSRSRATAWNRRARIPRDYAVNSGDDLLAVLAAAPPRSVIVLADDGPYVLGGGTGTASARLVRRDVTIKADAGVRPVLKLARETGTGSKAPAAILDLIGGHITLEGLEFVVEPGDREESAAIRTEDTELTLRRCLFRRSGTRSRHGRAAALQLRASAAPTGGERPVAVLADACHFDAGPAGVIAKGPIDLQLRDCTLAASEVGFWFANDQAAVAVPVALRLRHDSILAGDGPVFRFEGTDPRVWIEDTVIAPAKEGEATLVATDHPDGIDWRGRFNLYSQVGVFLKPTGGPSEPRTDPRHAHMGRFAGRAPRDRIGVDQGARLGRGRPRAGGSPRRARTRPGFSG